MTESNATKSRAEILVDYLAVLSKHNENGRHINADWLEETCEAIRKELALGSDNQTETVAEVTTLEDADNDAILRELNARGGHIIEVGTVPITGAYVGLKLANGRERVELFDGDRVVVLRK